MRNFEPDEDLACSAIPDPAHRALAARHRRLILIAAAGASTTPRRSSASASRNRRRWAATSMSRCRAIMIRRRHRHRLASRGHVAPLIAPPALPSTACSSGHFRHDFLPLGAARFMRDFIAAARFRLAHRLGDTTPCRRRSTGRAVRGVMMLLSGLAIWKPVHLAPLTALFGGFQGARLVHFIFMAALVLSRRACDTGDPGAEDPGRDGAGPRPRAGKSAMSLRPPGA